MNLVFLGEVLRAVGCNMSMTGVDSESLRFPPKSASGNKQVARSPGSYLLRGSWLVVLGVVLSSARLPFESSQLPRIKHPSFSIEKMIFGQNG